VREFYKINWRKSLLAISIDWLLIAFAIYLTMKIHLFFFPVSLLIIGSRQRALSNLTHDASHRNLFLHKSINDLITNVFCAVPMFETVAFYRQSHMKHHKYLGNIEHDPDSISHLSAGYNDHQPWSGDPITNFARLIFNKTTLRTSLFGSLHALNMKDLFFTVFQWSLVIIVSGKISWIITLLWFSSKLSTYHFIRILAEYLDHSGLKQGSVLSFTRNLPHKGILCHIFHPHSDTYHIVHHLHPKVPHYNLAQAHEVLLNEKEYAMAHHCDSYIQGRHAAVSCWVGKCQGVGI